MTLYNSKATGYEYPSECQYSDILSPLSQFEIYDLISMRILNNFYISITNIGFYLMLGALFLLIINLITNNYFKLNTNK